MPRIGLLDLLALCGYPPEARAKLVRHQGGKYDPEDLLRHDWLDAYLQTQSKPIFHKVAYVISLVGVGSTHARLHGVFKVLGHRPGPEGKLPAGCPYVEWLRPGQHYYELEHQRGYEELEHRLIIEWGGGTRAWHQRASNKAVVQLKPPGQRHELFKDYLDFTLTHTQLQDLFTHADANSEWRSRLQAVAGIYLILATTTGHQYIGSASGVDGIWGRWQAYNKDGHGGNAKLKRLLASDPAYPDGFTYSILQILPRSTTRQEVLAWERQFKEKLGTLATGLNQN